MTKLIMANRIQSFCHIFDNFQSFFNLCMHYSDIIQKANSAVWHSFSETLDLKCKYMYMIMFDDYNKY